MIRVLIDGALYQIQSIEPIQFQDMVVTFFELENSEFCLVAIEAGESLDYVLMRRHIESTLMYCPWAINMSTNGLCSAFSDNIEAFDGSKTVANYNLMYGSYGGSTYKHELPCHIGFYEADVTIHGNGFKGVNALIRYEGTEVNGFVDIYFGSLLSPESVEINPS